MFIKGKQFQVIQFIDKTMREQKPIIILYVLGEDGIVYEMTGGQWRPYPIEIAPVDFKGRMNNE